MLRISRRTDYAIRVMIAVARSPYGVHIPSRQIGDDMQIPQSFLVKVIGDLKQGNLITTIVGRGGGLKLACPADTVTLRDIVEAVEGPVDLAPRSTVTDGDQLSDVLGPAHRAWRQVQHALNGQLESIKLADLVAD